MLEPLHVHVLWECVKGDLQTTQDSQMSSDDSSRSRLPHQGRIFRLSGEKGLRSERIKKYLPVDVDWPSIQYVDPFLLRPCSFWGESRGQRPFLRSLIGRKEEGGRKFDFMWTKFNFWFRRRGIWFSSSSTIDCSQRPFWTSSCRLNREGTYGIHTRQNNAKLIIKIHLERVTPSGQIINDRAPNSCHGVCTKHICFALDQAEKWIEPTSKLTSVDGYM